MRGPSIIAFWLGLRLLAACGTPTTALARSGAGDDADGIAFFEKSIRPIFAEKCQKCHGGDKAKGGLSLTGREALLKGGDSGPAAVPGKPRDSLLIQAVERRGELKMPPKGKLSPGEIERLGRWIERGLPWPEAEALASNSARSRRGASVVVVPAGSCDVSTAGEGHGATALRDRPVHPGGPRGARAQTGRARRQTHVDPPRDLRPDRLAADARTRSMPSWPTSPRMPSPGSSTGCWPRPVTASDGRGTGSTWCAIPTSSTRSGGIATGWSEPSTTTCRTTGSSSTRSPATCCPPRPSTVNADGIVATTMLAIGPWGGIDRTKRLADIVDDQIDTIGRSFLGLTIACARCHDHKFDPISTADYYGLAGFFFSSRILSDLAYLSHNAAPAEGPAGARRPWSRNTAGGRTGSARRRTGSRRPSTGTMRRLRGASCPRSRTTCWRRGMTRTVPPARPGSRRRSSPAREGLHGFAVQRLDRLPGRHPRRARSAGWIGRSATSTASGASRSGWPPLSGPGGRTTARITMCPSRPSCSRRARCR